ncbi:cell wall-active antibiotics response protein LiaF [Evansella sp. AB-rgal1]|uniref:cell wall-active antibiotics response protein LiaF n=1 Tax=Evansella sp. AB-rgal1 TaxID=3242696 RepID=UPI00359F0ACF
MKNFIGILILATGVIFLLSNTGVIDTDAASIFSTFWPILIILIGIKVFFEGLIYFFHGLRRSKFHVGKAFWGALILAMGTIILGNNAGWFIFSISDLWSWTWPLLVVYIGFKIIFDRNVDIVVDFDREKKEGRKEEGKKSKNSYKKNKENRVKHNTFLGEISLGKQPFELDGADISLSIGDIDIDLTKAILKEGENYLDIRGWIGDVEILVPRDMPIQAIVNVKLGEVKLFDDQYSGTGKNASYTSSNFHDAEKKVILHVNLNIGDVEVLTVD